MNWLYIGLGLLYSGIIFYFYIGILRLPRYKQPFFPRVSVLVPARNEEKHILECLESLADQSYPDDLYEVIVIDDRSEDATAMLVDKFAAAHPRFKLVRHTGNGRQPTYKKQALKYGLQFAGNEIIMTIDADTVAQPRWIEQMMANYDDQTGLVAGLITFNPAAEEGLFDKLQTLEFAGIVFCGVGAAGNDNPIICNGSNLSYRRRAFEEVGGYDGNLHLPSGDDDLLLQNIHGKTNWKIRYSVDPETINYTQPVDSLRGFLNQRARWASKALHYPTRWIFLPLFAIYLFYVLIFVSVPLLMLNWLSLPLFIAAVLCKTVPEFLLIRRGLRILGRTDLLPLFPVAELFQVPYILYAGFMGFFQKYSWKDQHK